jgi:hypothetical protein
MSSVNVFDDKMTCVGATHVDQAKIEFIQSFGQWPIIAKNSCTVPQVQNCLAYSRINQT